MNNDTFNLLIMEIFYRCLAVLGAKAVEYAPNNDRLENFKEAAFLQSISPEEALFGMLTKHIVSLSIMCKLTNSCATAYAQEVWEEKITDSINYLFLLEALVTERYGWERKTERANTKQLKENI